ncbi:hypothetical protein PFISCL1PPCAC_2870 [Pristionchus fissidentatus]|uniref:Uncharacterized protein n=1 Tax=Pristionchus fissidentatus TaxID=1538716 RepID=A0AAV5UZE3_9BILA|nr:hypothetical protein PFISCL1PPCAC_2870 [Pristionchus fissidentatus]
MKSLLIISLSLPLLSALPWGTVQSAAVKGKLVCNGEPAGDVKVKLYDVDTFDPDDLMAEGVSSAKGTFQLSGSEKESTTIDPKVNIYHKCNYNGMCLKKIAIVIPKDFVTEGETPQKVFDIGEINLAGRFSGETTDCLN